MGRPQLSLMLHLPQASATWLPPIASSVGLLDPPHKTPLIMTAALLPSCSFPKDMWKSLGLLHQREIRDDN